jgi:hypothetical protein
VHRDGDVAVRELGEPHGPGVGRRDHGHVLKRRPRPGGRHGDPPATARPPPRRGPARAVAGVPRAIVSVATIRGAIIPRIGGRTDLHLRPPASQRGRDLSDRWPRTHRDRLPRRTAAAISDLRNGGLVPHLGPLPPPDDWSGRAEFEQEGRVRAPRMW